MRYTNLLSLSRYLRKTTTDNWLLNLLNQYVNALNLRVEKVFFGIDSSGLVQIVFSMIGVLLPRYARQQVEFGTVVDFLV